MSTASEQKLRRHRLIGLLCLAAFGTVLCGCATAPVPVPVAATPVPGVAGHWLGTGPVQEPYFAVRELRVDLQFGEDGSVGGWLGDARIRTWAKVRSASGWFGWLPGLRQEPAHVLWLTLDGPLIAAEGVFRSEAYLTVARLGDKLVVDLRTPGRECSCGATLEQTKREIKITTGSFCLVRAPP